MIFFSNIFLCHLPNVVICILISQAFKNGTPHDGHRARGAGSEKQFAWWVNSGLFKIMHNIMFFQIEVHAEVFKVLILKNRAMAYHHHLLLVGEVLVTSFLKNTPSVPW